jgi:F-type H+-transporting ATPase subunit gamma
MANVLDIKRRIRSVLNTRQITKAMKMVSAAKLRRAQERALAARPYALMMTNVLKSLVSRAELYDAVTGQARHPLLEQREEKNVLVIVVTGDKGLAGAFNTNINKAATRFLETKAGKNVDLECIGRKGRDFLRRRYPAAAVQTAHWEDLLSPTQNGAAEHETHAVAAAGPADRVAAVQVIGEHVGVLAKVEYAAAHALANSVIDRYTRGEIDSVYVVFNEFKSVIAQRLVVDQILPIEQISEDGVHKMAEEASEEERLRRAEAAKTAGVSLREEDISAAKQAAASFGTAGVDYIYEQAPEVLFRALLPKYVTNQIFRSMLESVAAEHAARMTAMDSATNNASDMIERLTLVMNRARQAKITKEIIEIVSGAAAQ